MIPPSAHSDALETCLEMDEAPIVHPVCRCSWCVQYGAPAPRWFMRRLDGGTIYVDAPEDGRVPSDGLCRPCYDKIKRGEVCEVAA